MANEEKKDFNDMLRQERDMPRIQTITDGASIRKYGGSRMLLAPPLDYDRLMRTVPFGRLTTVGELRACLARRYGADFTDPLTAGLFVSMAAWASTSGWWSTLVREILDTPAKSRLSNPTTEISSGTFLPL